MSKANGKTVDFPSEYVSLSEAIYILENHLGDDSVSIKQKVLSIRRVSEMETMNSVKKDTLKSALVFLFEHYDFEF